jgi:hypothetical protein
MPSLLHKTISRIACGVYRQLLRAYPAEFQARFGAEMNQLFRDQLRDALSQRGFPGFLRFSLRIAADLPLGILRERLTLQTLLAMFYLAAALAFASYAAYVDRHTGDDVYPTLAVVMVCCFIMGLIRPTHAWRWALIVSLGVPFLGPPHTLPARLLSPGRWAMLAVLLIPGLFGAYAGSILRRAVAAMQ